MEPWVPWAEAAGVAALGGATLVAAYWVSGRSWWLAACLAAAALIGVFGAARWAPRLELLPPFSWALAGRTEYALRAPAAAMALLPPSMRLPHRRQRVLVGIFLAIVIGQYSVVPFLSPALARPRLAALRTQMDGDDVCLQGTSYTCGPAAAVTALRRLGIEAEEFDLAVRMHTCPALGTPADVLAAVLQEHYGAVGLHCEYRSFTSVDELPRGTPTLAVVKHSFLVDHFVAVLEVTDKGVVIVGDPQLGKLSYTRDAFERRWRFMGVVLTRAN